MIIQTHFYPGLERMFHSQSICIFIGIAVWNGHTKQNPFILPSLNSFLLMGLKPTAKMCAYYCLFVWVLFTGSVHLEYI